MGRYRKTTTNAGVKDKVYVSLGTQGGTDGHPRWYLFAATGGMGPT